MLFITREEANTLEHWESLCPGGLRFVYDDVHFRPGTDTFLLSSLPHLKPGARVCDLGCGAGLLSLLLLQRQPRLQVTGVELQPEAAALCRRTAEENQLGDRLRTVTGDLRNIRSLLPAGSFDLVVCNPPYYPPGSGKVSSTDPLRCARSEQGCTLEEVCAAAAYLLRWSGSFCLVHKPERLTDVLCALRSASIEPKRLRMVSCRAGQAPSLILVEGRRGGRPGLQIDPPLILETPEGVPTQEVDAIYFRKQEDTP